MNLIKLNQILNRDQLLTFYVLMVKGSDLSKNGFERDTIIM